jgi:putative protein-disulfide isomerase
MTILHYIFDPLCGWCYGAAPLVSAARSVPGLAIALHGGGMMTGVNRHAVTPQLRNYVMAHDKRIAQLSGQPFGAAYFDGLLRDAGAVFDSAPPTTAILAAEEMAEGSAGTGLDMLHRLQQSHYVLGKRIGEITVLLELAQELGLDQAAFAQAYGRLAGAATERHFSESRAWLSRTGGHGFPTLALEYPDGTLEQLDISAWQGRATEWTRHLQGKTSDKAPSEQISSTPYCSVDGCAL